MITWVHPRFNSNTVVGNRGGAAYPSGAHGFTPHSGVHGFTPDF